MPLRFSPDELDPSLHPLVKAWQDPPTAFEVFRVYDEITLMQPEQRLISYRLLKELEEVLQEALRRENTTLKALAPRALWRDQDF